MPRSCSYAHASVYLERQSALRVMNQTRHDCPDTTDMDDEWTRDGAMSDSSPPCSHSHLVFRLQ